MENAETTRHIVSCSRLRGGYSRQTCWLQRGGEVSNCDVAHAITLTCTGRGDRHEHQSSDGCHDDHCCAGGVEAVGENGASSWDANWAISNDWPSGNTK